MIDITHFSVLYIDQIPDELNARVWSIRLDESSQLQDEGGPQIIMRDTCREMIHAMMVDHDTDTAPDDPAMYSPTVYVRMVPDQRQMMVVVPYAVDPNLKKFMGRPCIVQGHYECARPVNRTSLTILMQDKARQYNNLLYADGYMEAVNDIAYIYDSACSSVLAAFCANTGIKRPHRFKGSLFPVENFANELDERNQEVMAKRGFDPSVSCTGRVVLELVDTFPSNRPAIEEAIEGHQILVFRRNPSFSSDIQYSGELRFTRVKHGNGARTVIDALTVQHDERRQGYASMMLLRLAKTYPKDNMFVVIHKDDIESLGFFRGATKKTMEMPPTGSSKQFVYVEFSIDDLLPHDPEVKKTLATTSQKK